MAPPGFECFALSRLTIAASDEQTGSRDSEAGPPAPRVDAPFAVHKPVTALAWGENIDGDAFAVDPGSRIW